VSEKFGAFMGVVGSLCKVYEDWHKIASSEKTLAELIGLAVLENLLVD